MWIGPAVLRGRPALPGWTLRVMERKKCYHHGNLPRALKDAALALVAESGLGTVTLRELARRVGVSHAAPCRHFPDRNYLLAEISAEGFAAIMAAMQQAEAQAPADPLAQFHACGQAYVLFAAANPAHYRVMMGNLTFDSRENRTLTEAQQATMLHLLGLIADCQRAGAMCAGDTKQLVIVAWGIVHGLSQLLIDGRLGPRQDGAALRSLVERLLELQYQGFAPRPAPAQ